MKFLQKAAKSFSKDMETLKTLSLPQKFRFIMDYYKGYAFILLCLILAGFYLGDAWMQTRRETVLEGFFTNDEANLFPAGRISKEFSRFLGLSPRQQVLFDDSLYVQPGSSIDYHTASQSKIVAYISARELDFLVTTKDLTDYYRKSLPLYDLEQLLPPRLADRLKNNLYYAPDSSGAPKACAISLEGSRFTEGTASQPAAPYYLMVFSYTEHRDTMIRFLEYAFENEADLPYPDRPDAP